MGDETRWQGYTADAAAFSTRRSRTSLSTTPVRTTLRTCADPNDRLVHASCRSQSTISRPRRRAPRTRRGNRSSARRGDGPQADGVSVEDEHVVLLAGRCWVDCRKACGPGWGQARVAARGHRAAMQSALACPHRSAVLWKSSQARSARGWLLSAPVVAGTPGNDRRAGDRGSWHGTHAEPIAAGVVAGDNPRVTALARRVREGTKVRWRERCASTVGAPQLPGTSSGDRSRPRPAARAPAVVWCGPVWLGVGREPVTSIT